jgi:hypothetical protein
LSPFCCSNRNDGVKFVVAESDDIRHLAGDEYHDVYTFERVVSEVAMSS